MQARSESSAGRSTAKAPSQNAQNEIERLKKQLEEKQMELEDVNADLRHLKQNATHSRVRDPCLWHENVSMAMYKQRIRMSILLACNCLVLPHF